MQSPILFGPVPSRRLGSSLGINQIPPHTCTYACVYCQLGRSKVLRSRRRAFGQPYRLLEAVREKVAETQAGGGAIDYITFVADGEPTLDINLGDEIAALKSLGFPVAVISNGALLSYGGVRRALCRADWVSVKVDSVDEEIWRAINRPHRALRLPELLEGMLRFAADFGGTLCTETMLIRRLNDAAAQLEQTAGFVARLNPEVAYLAVPTRPPAEPRALPPDESTLHRAWHIFADRLPRVELLTGYEGDAFGTPADPESGLLGITSVHPMREDALRHYLQQAGAGWELVEKLLGEGRLKALPWGGHTYYLRRILK
jgi:wyosine [tRNA(Phe)-imidazoG37] synthetase (radical SAM superfamily)